MGFGPSAGWAQGLTDVTTASAGLDPNCRLHPDELAPRGFPIWGSICDDIWAIDNAQAGDRQTAVGPLWLTRAEEAWRERGVDPNVKKSIDIAEGAEVQGYYIHPDRHWVGVSLLKRSQLFQATIYILSQHQVLVGDVERLVGKYG